MKAYLKAAYVRVSRLLHHTPLSRVRWVASLHNWLYGRLSFGDRVSVGGFRLYVDPRDRTIAKKIALYGGYEPFLQGVLLRHAQAGTVVIDVGANVGLHTLPLAGKVGKSGRVIAFEPDPENHALLLKNLQANGLLSRVTAHNVGLSDKGGGALLYQSAANRGGLSLKAENVDATFGPAVAPVEVRLAIGDDVLGEQPAISLVKIDVEGAEPLVINGLQRTLAEHPEAVLVFEFSPSYVESFGIDPRAFLADLQGRGYSIARIDEGDEGVSEVDIDELIASVPKSGHAVNLIAARQRRPPSV